MLVVELFATHNISAFPPRVLVGNNVTLMCWFAWSVFCFIDMANCASQTTSALSAIQVGASALSALGRQEAAATLQSLNSDLEFFERVSVKFLRKNVDPQLMASKEVEEEINRTSRQPPQRQAGSRHNAGHTGRARSPITRPSSAAPSMPSPPPLAELEEMTDTSKSQ